MDDVVVAPPQETEQVEAVADATVEVAEIQADRDVQIAEIQAEVITAEIEARTDIDQVVEARTDEWRRLYETLGGELSDARQQITTMQTQIDQLMETITAQAVAIAALTPPPVPEDQSNREPPSPEPPERVDAPEDQRHVSETDSPSIRKRKWM